MKPHRLSARAAPAPGAGLAPAVMADNVSRPVRRSESESQSGLESASASESESESASAVRPESGSEPVPSPSTVAIWRFPLRLAHWALAGSVLGCLWLHEGGPWHVWLGYLALAVAGWRIVIGCIGPQPDRFSCFVRGPSYTRAYLRALWQGRAPRHLGHNPLGAWMIVTLLCAALVAGLSGALYDTDRFWGDEAVYRLHQIGGWAFAVLVPLHLGGVLLSSVLQRENLVRSMITGRKRAPGAGEP